MISVPPAAVRIAPSSPEDLVWAASIIGNGLWPEETKGITIYRAGQRRAVVGYNAFYDGGCSAHIASDGSRDWVSRGALYAMFAYPFEQCGLDRVSLLIGVRNINAQVFALKLGFSFDGRVRHTGEDKILFGMLRSECIWTKGN